LEDEIIIPDVFQPLFELIEGKHPDVEEVVITGGRESSKTFTTSLGLCYAVADHNHRVLYTRYTLTSAEKSIIPAFQNRIELLGYADWFHTAGKSIRTAHNDGKIDFAGYKTSSGNQTAALKSLEDYSIQVLEEAEEYKSYEEYEKVHLSLRAKDVQPFSVLILNPAHTDHWIYKKFYEEKGVDAGYCGIQNGVLYIHSTYRDLGKKFVAKKNWNRFEAARLIYEQVQDGSLNDKKSTKLAKWYDENILGGWKSSLDGICIPNWNYFETWPEDEPTVHIFGIDWGFDPDPFTLIECRIYGNKIYCKEHVYRTGLLNRDIIELIHKIIPEDCYVVCDSSEKKTIADFRAAGVHLIAAKKPPGSIVAGIKKLNSQEVFIHKDSDNLVYELNHYRSVLVENTKGEIKIQPLDKDNHAIDAIRYANSLY
jgi:phage terminase large subunit